MQKIKTANDSINNIYNNLESKLKVCPDTVLTCDKNTIKLVSSLISVQSLYLKRFLLNDIYVFVA
jgi:hypothetical protein